MADIIKNKDFGTKNDWLDQLLLGACSAIKTVKRMVDGKEVEDQERDGVDVEKLHKLALENGFTPKVHNKANPGLHRMTVGNALRARARRRHGLTVEGKFLAASESFIAGHDKVENADGSKYESPGAKAEREAKEKAKAADAAAKLKAAAKEKAKVDAASGSGQGSLNQESWSRPQRPP